MNRDINASHILDGHSELKKLVETSARRRRYTPSLRSMIESDFEAILYAHNCGCIWADVWEAYRRERGIDSPDVSLKTTFRYIAEKRDKNLHNALVEELKQERSRRTA